MPEGKLDATDAAGLAEMLQFLSEWLTRDPARLGAALAQFAGHLACGLAQLRGDLERFVFLLGGSDGEQLSGPSLEGWLWPAATASAQVIGAGCCP